MVWGSVRGPRGTRKNISSRAPLFSARSVLLYMPCVAIPPLIENPLLVARISRPECQLAADYAGPDASWVTGGDWRSCKWCVFDAEKCYRSPEGRPGGG